MGLPELLTPTENGALIDRQLRWKQPQGVQPSIHDMFVYEPFGFASLMEIFVDGARTKVIIPKIPSQESIVAALSVRDRGRVPADFIPPSDMARGGLIWQHQAIFVPNLNFANWSYGEIGQLNRRAWTTDVHAFVYGQD
jgi:hypothetical protein